MCCGLCGVAQCPPHDGFLRHLTGAKLAPGGGDGEAEGRPRTVLIEAKEAAEIHVLLDRVCSLVCVRPFTTIADRASAPFLTGTGDALFETAGETTAALTRVRQVHRLGAELMSCELRDDSIVDPVVSAPFAMGSVAAYNGRSLMLVSADDECPVCLSHNDFNARPRLVVYDLGPNAPALSKRGWVAPRGTAGGSGRSY